MQFGKVNSLFFVTFQVAKVSSFSVYIVCVWIGTDRNNRTNLANLFFLSHAGDEVPVWSRMLLNMVVEKLWLQKKIVLENIALKHKCTGTCFLLLNATVVNSPLK